MAETIWDIKSLSLFDGLNPAQVHNLIEIAQRTEYKKNKIITRHGEKSREIFILVKGKAEIISGHGASLYFLKEKETFGEIGFVCGLDRTATVIARKDSLVLSINHNLLENISNTDPEIKNVLLQNMVQSLGEKLVQANRRIEELVFKLKKTKPSTAGDSSSKKRPNINLT